jgi:NAD(P) transhydrogenase
MVSIGLDETVTRKRYREVMIGRAKFHEIARDQTALQHAATIDSFVENIFNIPTLAETYRVAALDIVGQRQKRVVSTAA